MIRALILGKENGQSVGGNFLEFLFSNWKNPSIAHSDRMGSRKFFPEHYYSNYLLRIFLLQSVIQTISIRNFYLKKLTFLIGISINL